MILLLSRDAALISQISQESLGADDRLRIAPDVLTAQEYVAAEPGLTAVLLDLECSGSAGFELCRFAHEHRSSALTIVVLPSAASPPDRYESFASGASDVMAKPIDTRELGLRLRAHGALRSEVDPIPVLRLGEMQVDLGCGEVRSGDRRRSLTPHEAAILRHLATRVGRCVPTEELLVEALGYPPRLGNPEIVRTHIRHLRQKLEPDPARPRWLVNVPRVGYRIACVS